MNIKQANNLLNYYRSKLSLLTSFLLLFLPSIIRDKLVKGFTPNNYYKMKRSFLGLRFIIYLAICIGLNYLISEKEIVITILLIYLFISLFTVYIECQKHANSHPDDHFLQLLGNSKTSYLNTQIISRGKEKLLYKLIPTTIPLLIFLIIYTQSYLINFIYLEASLLLYQVIILSNYLRLLINNSHLKFSFIFDKLFKSLISLIVFILLIILLSLIFIINSIFISFSLNTTLIITIFYLIVLLLGLSKLNKVILNLVMSDKKVIKHLKYQTNNITNQTIFPLLNNLLFKLNSKKRAIIIKDFKMLIRSKRKEFISLQCLNLIAIILGLFTIKVLKSELKDSLLTIFYLINIIISGVIYALYAYHKITWFSSESENYYLYYKANVSYYEIFKAKVYLNKLLTFPYWLLFTLVNFISVFNGLNSLILWSFITIYLYLLANVLIKTILYYDFVGPKLNLNFDYRAMSDKTNLFTFIFILLFLVPLMVIIINQQILSFLPQKLTYYFLLIVLGFLLLLNIISSIKAKSLNKIERISAGGVDYVKS